MQLCVLSFVCECALCYVARCLMHAQEILTEQHAAAKHEVASVREADWPSNMETQVLQDSMHAYIVLIFCV